MILRINPCNDNSLIVFVVFVFLGLYPIPYLSDGLQSWTGPRFRQAVMLRSAQCMAAEGGCSNPIVPTLEHGDDQNYKYLGVQA